MWSQANKCPFETLTEVHREIEAINLEACQLIVGIDFTKSNMWTGKECFAGKCLHDVDGPINPYRETLSFCTKRLGVYDDDQRIPCYGFGDVTTGANSVFSLFHGHQAAHGMGELLDRYTKIAPVVRLSGPTSFAPLIHQAMRDVYNSGMKYHVLLILADGQVSPECQEQTKQAIIDACHFPLSIIMIGVGDGPWTEMNQFDNELRERPWDNFHFLDFNKTIQEVSAANQQRKEEKFELHVLEEIPEQYKYARARIGAANKAKLSRFVQEMPANILIDPPTHFS